MLTFLRTRLYILLALAFTLLALVALLTRQSYDAEWMLRWNHVDGGQVQLVYACLIGVLLLALPFAPRIRGALRRGKAVVFVVVAAASFLSIGLLEPNQEHRLFITPFSIWVIIAHIIAVCVLVAAWSTQPSASDQPTAPMPFNNRYLIGIIIGGIALLAGLHILSVGEFMPLDLPDEPWLTSMATNYAENNDLSPSFIGSSYGTPDPVLPRYYWLMGLWLRAAGSSLVALRLMPLFVLALVVAIMALILWRCTAFTTLQRLGGLLVLLAMSPLVRMSHNLRADIGLAVYGALVLWALLNFFNTHPRRNSWAVMAGLALYIGLETIPFIALILAVVVGVMLILWLLRNHQLRQGWQAVVLYVVCSALALGLYAAVRFLPDVQASLSRYQRFNGVYAQQTGFGTLHFPLESLINYHLRFSLILSPVEWIFILVVLVLGWRWGKSAQHWILLTFGLALVLMLTAVGFTYSYWTLFVPLVAYIAASVFTTHRVFLVAAVTLVPAMVAAPVMDFAAAVQVRPNQALLQSVDALTPRIPTGITVVGESVLWFTLHSQRTFIGIDGFWINLSGHPERSINENIEALGVDVLICREGNEACNAIFESGLFQPPEVYSDGSLTYLIYWRTP